MIKYDDEGYIVVFDTPKTPALEFRLYYDDSGNVVCYSCEKLEGKYIVIDSSTYAQARPDIRVVDGKIVNLTNKFVVSKLIPGEEGKTCLKKDISIIANNKTKVKTQKWKLHIYEL